MVARLTEVSLLVVLVFVVGDNAAAPKAYNTSMWMKEMKDIIYDRSLLEITLPGTHDSGAYVFNNVLSPIEPKILDDLIQICSDLHIDLYSFIKNWSQTQDTTIYEQLSGGIRYLDLRACFIKGDWYTEHFLIGTRTQDLLNDIATFMSENTGEVIVVELGNLVPVGDELTLIKMVEKTLGHFLAPKMHLNKTTIGEMVKKNQRIVLLYPHGNFTANFTFLWDKTMYMEGSYANSDKLADMEKWNVDEINANGGHGLIFELSWTLTTQDSDIVRTLLDPIARNRNLRDFAIDADNALDQFAKQYSNYQLGNVLLLDWWELSNIVGLAILQNTRQCYDDSKYVPVVKSGQYCRNYFLNGNCTDVNYIQWMGVHCRLSCGFC